MSVTVDQVQAVRSALADEPSAWEYDNALSELDSYLDRLRFRQAVSESPYADLARQMYERVADDHAPTFDESTPKNGHHWLLAAEAAQAILAPKREPRVFIAGDPEPADRATIVLEGREINAGDWGMTSHVGERVRITFGDHGTSLTSWWQMNDTPDERTHASWHYWLSEYGPFTEVLESRIPRVFTEDDPEPTDVKYIRDEDGDLFRYVRPDRWYYRTAGGVWGTTSFSWRELTMGKGATEDLEYTE